jgi:hypothetical protein
MMLHNRVNSHDPNEALGELEESGYTPPLTPVSETSRLVMAFFDTPRHSDVDNRPGNTRDPRRDPGRVPVPVPCRRYVTLSVSCPEALQD